MLEEDTATPTMPVNGQRAAMDIVIFRAFLRNDSRDIDLNQPFRARER